MNSTFSATCYKALDAQAVTAGWRLYNGYLLTVQHIYEGDHLKDFSPDDTFQKIAAVKHGSSCWNFWLLFLVMESLSFHVGHF